jgi:uncharacterized membrane protein YphA (DoxX/SURF4 family)
MLSGIFVISGVRSVRDPDRLVPRAKRVTDRVAPLLANADPRLPTDPRALVRAHGAVQVAAGLMLATGRLTRPAAAVLAGTLVPSTLAGHPFWTEQDAARRATDQTQFFKNVGLLGGLLLAVVDTRGRPGLGWRASHAVGSGARSVRRAVRTARRDAKIAVRSATAARRLPG